MTWRAATVSMPTERAAAFPNESWNAANYWVDVVFQAGTSPTLTSIVVTPANPSILTGASQQFTATGTYSDGSTQDITSQAIWTSSDTAVATIDAGGLATGISAGTTMISASLAGVTGSTDADRATRAVIDRLCLAFRRPCFTLYQLGHRGDEYPGGDRCGFNG